MSPGYTLLQVHAHDADGSAPNNQVFYSIEEGDHDSFQVGHTSGEIKVVGKLDRETVANYTLRIIASDEGAPPSVSYCDVYIDLSDINDELPQFREKHVLIQISDGVFGAIYTMSAVDRDLNSRLLYSIVWNDSYALSSSLAVLRGDQLSVRDIHLTHTGTMLLSISLLAFIFYSFPEYISNNFLFETLKG